MGYDKGIDGILPIPHKNIPVQMKCEKHSGLVCLKITDPSG